MSMLRGFLDWVVHGDNPHPPKAKRTAGGQLVAERERVARQIEILEAGPARRMDWTPETPRLLGELREALAALDSEIRDLGAKDE